jgi:hypothetical protein
MTTTTGDWMIRISGYGTFEFKGIEEEAEEMRAHKANWERGMGMKWRVGKWAKESDKIAAQIAEMFDAGKGASGKLMDAMPRAKRKESAEAAAGGAS